MSSPSFPDSSIGKESACNAGDPGSIPGLGRFAGEGIVFPLQYSWASLVAQLVKNPPAMQVDLGSIPGLERSPGEGKGYSFQYSGLENFMDSIVHRVAKSQTVFWPRELHGLYSPQGHKESDTTEHLLLSLSGNKQGLKG